MKKLRSVPGQSTVSGPPKVVFNALRTATISIVIGLICQFVPQAMAQQSVIAPSDDGYQLRGTAGFGTGAQVELETSNFPERTTARRHSMDQAAAPQSAVTRQTSFGIPFNITSGAVVVEAQLHVSSDHGETWTLYSRQQPQAREFPFRAERDGEYWFAIKTIDPNGIASPPGRPRAEMIIAVDTTNPEVNFNVHTDQSGQLECWWRATDMTLNADSLEINYRPHSPFGVNLARWKKAGIEVPLDSQKPGEFESRASFFPETESLTLDVQAKITDRAGNVSTVDRRVLLSRLTNPKERTGQRPPSIDPYGARQVQVAKQIKWRDEQQRRVATNQNGWQSAPPKTQIADSRALLAAERYAMDPRRARSTTAPPRINHSGYSGNQQQYANRSLREARPSAVTGSQGQGWKSVSKSEPAQMQFASDKDRDNKGADASQRTRSVPFVAEKPKSARTRDPYYDSSVAARARSSRNTVRADRSSSIAEDNIRVSSSRRFQLDYEVDSIGPDGVARVEIWMTEDEGRSWFVKGEDEDRRSPIIVDVDEDGLYGFRVGVTGQGGLSARPPRSGDDADVWIGVDTTRPEAAITSVPYGKGSAAGSLVINWTADDEHLAARPITLLFADNVDGPWEPIASDIANDSIYTWRVDSRMPREVYLRMEARDTANNTAVHILKEPISLNGLVPRGRIRSVQPIQ